MRDNKEIFLVNLCCIFKKDLRIRKIINIGFVVSGILVAGLCEVFSNIFPDNDLYFAGWIFGLFIAFIGGVFFSASDSSEPSLLFDAYKAIDSNLEKSKIVSILEKDFEWISRLSSVSEVLNETLEIVIYSNEKEKFNMEHVVGVMLDRIVTERICLFSMEDELWNFAVYIWDENEQKLHCIACRRPTREDQDKQHRRWAVGEGHVGVAFQKNKEMISADTSDGEAAALFDAPDELRQDTDRRRYRSIASLPIRLANSSPIGVLVATSDIAGRFYIRSYDEPRAFDPVEPLRRLATRLALLNGVLSLSEVSRGGDHAGSEANG